MYPLVDFGVVLLSVAGEGEVGVESTIAPLLVDVEVASLPTNGGGESWPVVCDVYRAHCRCSSPSCGPLVPVEPELVTVEELVLVGMDVVLYKIFMTMLVMMPDH